MDYAKFFYQKPWWLPLIVLPLMVLCIHIFVNLLYKYAYPKQVQKGHLWRALFYRALYLPFKTFLWFSLLIVLVSLYAYVLFDVKTVQVIVKALQVGLVVVLGWAFYIFFTGLQGFVVKKYKCDRTTYNLFSKVGLILVSFVTLLLLLPIFGVEITGLLAFGGFGGIVVGFASKEAISNILGGLVLSTAQPFRIGHWIYTTDRTIDGVVEEVGWRVTKLRTPDKKLLYIPNAFFSTATFVNGTLATNRRIVTTLGIPYTDQDKIEKILLDIREYVASREEIDQKLYNCVRFLNLGTSSLDIVVRVFTKTNDEKEYEEFTEIFLLDLLKIVRNNGSETACPVSEVHIKEYSLVNS